MEPKRSGDGSGELIGIGSGKRKGKRKGIISGKRTGISSETLKLLLTEALKTRVKNQISSRLTNIDDQGERIEALRECLMHQQRSISVPVQIEKSERIEDLGALVDTLAGEISSSMVAEFVKQEDNPVCALDSCSEVIRDLWENFPRYEDDLALLSKVQSISASIDMLRRLEPELDRKLRSMEADEKELSEDHLDCKLRSMALQVDEEEVSKDEETKSESIAAGMVVEGLDAYRSCWESLWRPARSFEDMTLASSMLFTHCTPGRMPRNAIVGSTLQIYSVKVKVAEIHGLESPLKVYGVVAARDTVDSSRNPIFLRPRSGCQILNLQDPFLHLSGPCRAIVSMNPVDIEIELKLKGATKSEDRILISKVYHYNGERLGTYLVGDMHCGIELCFQQLKQSIQATISRVQIVERDAAPFPHGGRVACFSLPHEQPEEIVMLDTKGGKMPMGKHRCIELSRKVVSVELEGRLKVMIQAYAPSGEITGGHVLFTPQKCGATKGICHLGEIAVEVTVAWSLLPSPKETLPRPLPVDRIC